jgi:hypothetical protein
MNRVLFIVTLNTLLWLLTIAVICGVWFSTGAA